MLLAEESALVALNPASGRHAVGARRQLNACLAGLLDRIDHALDSTDFEPVSNKVRRLIAEASAAAAAAATVAVIAATSG